MPKHTLTRFMYQRVGTDDNDEGYTYYLGSDDKRYYQTTNAQKLEGCETATISVTCHDGAKLGEGSTQYKCSTCGGSVNQHTKECVMATSVVETPINTTDIDTQINDMQTSIALIQNQITDLENENTKLLRDITTSSVEDAARYRRQYNSNKDRISQLKSELSSSQSRLKGLQQARLETDEGESASTDDYYRIPAIMQDCKNSYSLTWNDGGSWSGNTYTRTASIPNINGVITFKATVEIARKPKYILGIKVHRAIVQISWSLTTEYSNSQVVAVVNLDPGKSTQEKADEVNARLAETARSYPDCETSVEYARSEPIETDDTEDTYHLLWSSDRLEIARDIDTRLTKIYSDLVSLEKMMHYKHSIIDMLRAASPYINEEQGRRRTLIEQSRRRWLRYAANSAHSDGYNGKYDEEDE